MRENWIRAKYVSRIFVKPFRKSTIKIVKSLDTGNYSLKIMDNSELTKIPPQNTEEEKYVTIENINELLHLASSYGDIPLISYSLALDADRNSIIDRANIYSHSCSESNLEDLQKIDNTLGYTPLIKAVHSVIISKFLFFPISF